MKGDVKLGERTLRITIGALEEMTDAAYAPAVVLSALASNIYTLRELLATVAAGLKGAGEDASAGVVIDDAGIQPARDAALEALRAAFKADAGNGDAAGKTEAATPVS